MANYDQVVTVDELSDVLSGTGGLSDDLINTITDLLDQGGGEVILGNFTEVPTKQEIAGSDLAFFTLTEDPDGAPVKINLSGMKAADANTLDTLIFSGDTSVTLTLPSRFDGVVVMGAGDDTVTSKGSKAVTVDTGAGNDTVSTGSGKDSIIISSGSDSIKTGSGNDRITVKDTLEAGDRVSIDGGAGAKDSVDFSALQIDHVTKSSSHGKLSYEITLDNGAKVSVTGVETVIYDTNGDGVAEVVGIRNFFNDFS